MIETEKPLESAILVGIIYPGQDEREVNDYLDEEPNRLKVLHKSWMFQIPEHL
jgi:hypothetical protein